MRTRHLPVEWNSGCVAKERARMTAWGMSGDKMGMKEVAVYRLLGWKKERAGPLYVEGHGKGISQGVWEAGCASAAACHWFVMNNSAPC